MFVVIPFMLLGTTSACAENTFGVMVRSSMMGNYLRVRGEYLPPHGMRLKCLELPPRARRIPVSGTKAAGFTGTTSACAENTLGTRGGVALPRNYLRVRGEYVEIEDHLIWLQELPPRARRILGLNVAMAANPGTTSACAENTGGWGNGAPKLRNYLRVRGEYPSTISRTFWMTELPPRARRIPV